jgi:hypothetical protein
VAASELYNTRLEAHLGARLGVRFAETTPPGHGKRPVREIVGVPEQLMTRWSSRRAAIEARTAELSKQFQADHGREPTHIEAIALAQQATLESREAKHEPRSLAEQRATWRGQAVEVLGRHGLTAMLAAALSSHPRAVPAADPTWVTAQAAHVIDTVSASRSTWHRHHVLAEAQRVVRATGHATNPALAEAITEAALAQPLSIRYARVDDDDVGEPEALRRRDGASVYSRNGTAPYTSAKTVAAERRIVAAATRTGGRCATNHDIELALADSAARGRTLNPGQAALVTEMATSGRRVALALAPAGTGKTTAMAALSHAWRSSGGTAIGLAPTAAAAIELGADLAAPTDTVAKYIDPARRRTPMQAPGWFERVDAATLIIIDEAGKTGTHDLDAVIGDALAKGASVRLIGDDGQLASISAGGVLRDLAAHTDALTLSQLVRFASPAEGLASLALRAGDPAGIGHYIDHHRVHVGAEDTAADMAYTAWRADLAAGRDSLLLAPTNTIVDALNARARLDRLTADTTSPAAEVVLADHLCASAGDVVRARRNARWLALGRNDFVRNGYRFTITGILGDGALRVRHLGTGRRLVLPADYLRAHLTLGYAATIDNAQGLTAEHSCHLVGGDHLSRQQLYVGMTRGKRENHIYLSTAETDPHRILTPKATHPDTAVDVLTRALARDDTQTSALSAQRDAHDPFTRLRAAADMYYDALGTAAAAHLGPVPLADLHTTAERLAPGLTGAEGWPVLRGHLALAAAAGEDPAALLGDAVRLAPLDGAADPAAVLDWRIDPTGGHSARIGPLRWLPAIPAALQQDPQWGPYLSRRADLVAELADAIRAATRGWTNATAPAWAKPILAADPVLAAEIAVFRAALGVAPEDSRLLGAERYAARPRAVQTLLETHAAKAIGRRVPDTRRWAQLIDSINPRIRTDRYWPQLAAHLADAARGRPDLAHLVTAAAAEAPLPDELPAAALWWRLAADLSPATLDTPNTRLRPPWIADLHEVFGSAVAETIAADPAWPGLVAAISAADPARWTARDLLHLAAEHLADADPENSIAAYEYARLITYTVDLFTGAHTEHTHPDIPIPEHPPLSPEDEEQLPPDHHDRLAELPSTTAVEHRLDQPRDPAFDNLSHTRPAPALIPALANVYALRDKHHQLGEHNAVLQHQINNFDYPSVRAAADEIRALRARADADRPYLLAVQNVIADWSDAEEDYDAALHHINWARTRLDALKAIPAADPLDVVAGQADVELRTMALPPTPPAQRFMPALTAAMAARAQAAGGADKIISGDDVDGRLAELRDTDRRALLQARTQRQQLRTALERAEATAAAAFAAAETRSAQHITEQLDDLRTELGVLRLAGLYNTGRPLRIPAAALSTPPLATDTALRDLAALPFTITPVRATPGPTTTAAMRTLRAAANAADRKVLWCSPTPDLAERARGQRIADATTTVADAHRRFRDQQWQLPPGSLLIVDDAAAAPPDLIADLAEHAATTQSGLILLDTGDRPLPAAPSARLLTLLQTELPWATALSAQTAETSTPPDLDPVLAQTGRLNQDLLTPEMREALQRRERIRAHNTATYRRHLTATRMRQRGLDRGIDRETGIDI